MNSEIISWKGCPDIAFARCSGTHTHSSLLSVFETCLFLQ